MRRDRTVDASGIEFLRSSDYGHYVSGSGGTGKSHLAQAIAQAAILQGHRVLYRETHILLEQLADTVADGTRKQFMHDIATVPLLIIDDFGMRKLPMTAAEDLLEIIMRRYERTSGCHAGRIVPSVLRIAAPPGSANCHWSA